MQKQTNVFSNYESAYMTEFTVYRVCSILTLLIVTINRSNMLNIC